ncbi:OprO/OprP family phosphate-selective porin [soil metagenome]
MSLQSEMRAGLLALLLSGAASAAFAQAPAPDAAAMQKQLDDFRVQLDQLRRAGVPAAQVQAMQKQLDGFAQQLADLKTAQTTDAADIATLKAPPVTAALPNGKPALASSDGRFSANIKAIVMFDAGNYMQKDNLAATVTNRDLNSCTNFRRARFGIDGKLFTDFDYSLIYEFGGSGGEDAGHIQEAWAQYTAFKPWKIKVGAYEPNIGLAAAVSTSQMPLMERPSPAEVARNIAAGDSRSALQVFGNGVWGSDSSIATRWFASGAVTGNTVGTINSTGGATAQPADEQTAFIGRFVLAPFSGTTWQAHFGVNAQFATQPNDAGSTASPRYGVQLRDRPELRIDGARLVDTGSIDARHARVFGAEAAFQTGRFLVESEYFDYKIDRRITGATTPSDPKFSGWYVQGVWGLTGETRPYNAAESRFDAPKMNFNFNRAAGTYGAWEVAARFSDLDLNYHDCGAGVAIPASPTACFDAVRGGEQKISSVGLNWYLNPSMRMMFDVQHVDIDRLNAAGVQVGQTYNAVAMRSQFNF